MNNIRDLHRNAMDAAAQAFAARRQGNASLSLKLFRVALELETEAADGLFAELSNEPSRSVLYRSAATLALDCHDYRAAEQLAARGLAGNPPQEIAQELRDVLEQAQFDQHLQVRGVILEPTEIQLTIAGSAVAPGMALADVFLDRVRDIERLVRRTFDRILRRSFQENRRANIDMFLSVPRTGSFAVSIRIGRPDQSILPGFEEIINDIPQKIIGEVITCFDLLNGYNEESLRARFEDSDPAYYQNFLALAQKIVPDGEKVNFVGLSTNQDGGQRNVGLRRQKDMIRPFTNNIQSTERGKRIEISGNLRFADEIGQTNRIKLVDEKGTTYTITVPEGMMSDIVKPLWGEKVIITGRQYKKAIRLETIDVATNSGGG